MKNLLYVFSLVIILFGCAKNDRSVENRVDGSQKIDSAQIAQHWIQNATSKLLYPTGPITVPESSSEELTITLNSGDTKIDIVYYQYSDDGTEKNRELKITKQTGNTTTEYITGNEKQIRNYSKIKSLTAPGIYKISVRGRNDIQPIQPNDYLQHLLKTFQSLPFGTNGLFIGFLNYHSGGEQRQPQDGVIIIVMDEELSTFVPN